MLPLSALGVLLVASTVSASFMQYIVMIPAELHYPSSENVCFHLVSTGPSLDYVNLDIILEHHGSSVILYNHVARGEPLKCVEITVPAPKVGFEEVATIRVSVLGPGVNFTESKKVLIRKINDGIFVQTDKPIYRPGQNVKFRIVTLKENFVPSNEKYSIIELKDPNGNRLAQWLQVAPNKGIVDLSFQLSDEPSLGTYAIIIENGEGFKTFDVSKYVLPKFEVIFVGPFRFSALVKSFQLKVCGRYTYGKMVSGLMTVDVCRKSYFFYGEKQSNLCKTYTGLTDKNGCFMRQIDPADFNSASLGFYSNQLEAVANLTENDTGVTLSGSQKYDISYVAGKVTFQNMITYYRTGQPYRGMMKVEGSNGEIMKGSIVYLEIKYGGTSINRKYTTDDWGRVSFSLETSLWNDSVVELWGKTNLVDPVLDYDRNQVYYTNDVYVIQPFSSSVQSTLQFQPLQSVQSCNVLLNIQVTYKLIRAEVPTNAKSVNFFYIITGKGGIVQYGQYKIDTSKFSALQGVFPVRVTLNSDFSPFARILGYIVLEEGQMVADKTGFEVEKCFKNKVTLGFSKQQDLPGAKIKLQLSAAPYSLCSVRAVDLSVLLLKPEQEMTSSNVYAMFPYSDRTGYPSEVDEFMYYDPCWTPVVEPLAEKAFQNWIPYRPPDIDVFYLFKQSGLKILTNCKIKKAVEKTEETGPCPVFADRITMLNAPGGPLESAASGPSPPQTVRTFFPETWLWSLVQVDASGKTNVEVTLPDTITRWDSMTFCTASKGFGLSTTASVTAFKPFFVDLTLPYSVVRGESFPLKATVFNYLKQCIMVQTTLAPSPDFQISQCNNCRYSSCICTNKAFTFTWTITATTLGFVNFLVTTSADEICGGENTPLPNTGMTDSLKKPLLVQPEGVPAEKTQSTLLCPEGSPVEEVFSLFLPPNVIPGSARAEVAVLGDIMGSALQNLGNLIQMPYGCGEQNMLTFAPIIYVLQYLEKTGQLTILIRTTAEGYLTSGYQRELNYKHNDGSYSAFGESDGDGNTWLTAFVAKCFSQAKAYIFVDDSVINNAVNWLQLHQNVTTGCFQSVGRLIHTSMKGGVNDDISLSAYITAALLEMGKTTSDPSVANALTCLQNTLAGVSSVYTKALLAYAFTLSGSSYQRATLLSELDSVAIIADGQMHWAYSSVPPPSSDYWSGPLSVDVETTAYVLLAMLSVPSVPGADIGKASQIVMWLTHQQNAYGGFASTQDTVVALQALAKYASLTYSNQGVNTVLVTTPQGFSVTFTVNNENRLLLQKATLTQIPGEYTVSASGQGCVYAQLTLRYNKPPKLHEDSFLLAVKTAPAECSVENPRIMELIISVMYTGSRNVSNMVLIEVQMLSGYIPVIEMESKLLQYPLVKRVDVKPDLVSIYLDELSHEMYSYNFLVSQDVIVQNIQPASVKVFDYYQPEENAVVDYPAPCSQRP
ncbi:alpha-2-macroglobulin-like protein 1 isoform X2 [Pleurodeles waltl]|uniref:alpha-2-macroglobulin-like protein 1 isoform X2 n=1 Tax=Pleurodeles waltl TaxID=8319 RepID=UPI00370991AC